MRLPQRGQVFGPGTVSRDAAWSLGYATVLRAGTAAISVVVARMLGPSGAGLLGVALQVTALGSLAATFSIPVGLARQLAGTPDPATRNRLLRLSALLVLALGTLAAITVSGWSGAIARAAYHDPSLAPSLAMSGPLIIATAAYLWLEGSLQGLKRFSWLARWGLVLSLADLAVVWPAAQGGVPTILLARSGLRALVFVLGIVFSMPRELRGAPAALPVPSAPREPVLRPLLAFAGPSFLGSLLTLLGQVALRALLVRSSGIGSAGQFQAADSVAQALLLVPTAATAAMIPAVSAEMREGGRSFERMLRRGIWQVTRVHLVISLAAMSLLPVVVVGVFGRDFSEARPLFVQLAVAYGLAGPGTVFGAVLSGRGEAWQGALLNLVWMALSVTSFSWLGRDHGPAGVAWAMSGAYLVLLALGTIWLPHRWRVRRRGWLPPILATLPLLLAGAAVALAPGIPFPLRIAGGLALAGLTWVLGRDRGTAAEEPSRP